MAYNRRIQRPSLQFLNPTVNAQNPKNVSQGNPYLAPEYTNNYELGYSTFYKALSMNFSTFVRNTTGSIEALRTVRGTDTVSTSYANIGQQNAYGGSINLNLNSGKLNLNGGGDFYYTTLTNNVPDRNFAASNEGFVISGRVGGSYNFTPVWGVQSFVYYRGRQVQLQGNQSGQGFYTVGVKRDFADKRGSLGFGFDNFFTPSITVRNTVVSPLIDQASANNLHTLGFRVNFNYRIGKLTATPTRRGKSINNDDLKSEGEGGGGGVDGGGGGGGAPAGGGRPGGGGVTRPAGAGGAPAGAAPGTRPAGAPGARPGGYPGAPGQVARPDSTAGDSTQTRPLTLPNAVPGTPNPTVQPADSTRRRPTAPLNTPNPTPVNAPSPGTTTPGGITPAGSPGGRP